MKTRKLLYWFAAIVLLGLIEYATATTNISSPDAPFQYPILVRLAELGVTETQENQISHGSGEMRRQFGPKPTVSSNSKFSRPDQITKLKALAGEIDSRVDSIIDRISHKVAELQGRDIALRCPGRRGMPPCASYVALESRFVLSVFQSCRCPAFHGILF